MPPRIYLSPLVVTTMEKEMDKGDSPHLCAAPFGPFQQMGTVPFFHFPLFLSCGVAIIQYGVDVPKWPGGLGTWFYT